MRDRSHMEKRQRVLADFGEFALRSDDLDAVLAQACRLVAEALGTGHAKVLEIEHDSRTLFVRAGVGWDEGVVGRLRLPMSEHSSETYSIELGEPVITNDLASEDRFDFPVFLKEAGVKALANVPVFLPGGRPFGLLQVDASEPRAFDDDDSQFLRTYATILGPVIDRLLKVRALDATEKRNPFLVRFSDAVRGLSDPMLVAQETCRMLTEQLGVDCTLWAVLDWERREYAAAWAFLADGTLVEPSRWPLDEREPFALEHLAGRSVVYEDVATDPRIPDPVKAAMHKRGLLAGIAVPVLVAGKLKVVLSTSQAAAPRRWRADEVAFVEALAERAWAEIERAQAETALRANEERYRNLFNSMDEAYAVVEILRDEAGVARDFRYVEVNPAFMMHTGMPYPVGKTATELLGTPNPRWAEIYGKVAETGEPVRWEESEITLDRVFDLNAFRLDGVGSQRVAVLFTNVTERKRAEAALRDSEASFRGVLDGMAEGFGLLAPDFTILEHNAEALRMDGRSRDAIVGRTHWDVYPGTANSKLGRLLKHAMTERLPVALEHHYAWAGGRARWLDMRAYPTADGALAVFWRDITERKEAEDALRESEERRRLTVELVPAQLSSASPDGQEMTLNEGWLAYTGQSEIEAQSYGWLDAIHPDDRDATRAAFEHAFATGEPLEREQRIRKAGDGWRWHLVRHVPVRDENGAITRWFGAAVDIHESKLAEQALKGAELRLQTLVEGLPQLVWRAVDQGRWTWASPQWTDYTGQAEADSHDRGWLAPVHPDDRERVQTAWEGAIERGEFHADYRICHAGKGRYRWFQTRATPVRDDAGAIIEWLGTSTDVDDMRAMQERQAVMVAELQHRTRNLLGVVRSISDRTLSRSDSLDAFRASFRDRLDALARVNGLLSRLNEDNRIAFGELIRTELSGHGLQDGDGGQVRLIGPEGVRLRSSHVQTLALGLHELATNAIKYGALSRPEGRLTVRWQVESDEIGEPKLRVEWEERGVAPELGPDGEPPRKGYGRELIERALPYQLQAETTYAVTSEGVRCTIALPISKVLQSPRDERQAGEERNDDRA